MDVDTQSQNRTPEKKETHLPENATEQNLFEYAPSKEIKSQQEILEILSAQSKSKSFKLPHDNHQSDSVSTSEKPCLVAIEYNVVGKTPKSNPNSDNDNDSEIFQIQDKNQENSSNNSDHGRNQHP